MAEENGVGYLRSYGRSILAAGIGRSLFLRFLLLSILPILFLSWISVNNSIKTIREYRTAALASVAHEKHQSLLAFFNATSTNLRVLADSTNTVKFLELLSSTYKDSNRDLKRFVGGYQWSLLEDQYGEDLGQFLTTYRYLDLLLLDKQGNMLYSIRQNEDFGSNLMTGKYANNFLSAAISKALATGEPTYSDVGFYEPYDNSLASFLAQAVVDEDGEKIGVVVIQLEDDSITKVMGDLEGFGKTGETYLIGDDLLMRSQSIFEDSSSLLSTNVETDISIAWLARIESESSQIRGTRRESYAGYRGVAVLGVSIPIEFSGVSMLMLAEIAESEALLPVQELIERAFLLMVVTIVLVVLLAVFSARTITLPIVRLTLWAKELSIGRLHKIDVGTKNNEIGILNDTFIRLVDSLQDVSRDLTQLSAGDLSGTMAPRGDDDVLVVALNQLRDSMKTVVDQTEVIAGGDYQANIDPRSEKDSLGIALQRMTQKLRDAKNEDHRKNWIKNLQKELADILLGDKDLLSLANELASFMVMVFKGSAGALYVVDPENDSNLLTFVGGHAVDERARLKSEVPFGEGFVGETALQQKAMCNNELPRGYLSVHSGLGESDVCCLLVAPFVLNGRVVGVIEVGGFEAFSDSVMEFIESASVSIAIAIDSYFGRQKTQSLLEKTQKQSSVLKTQQDELVLVNSSLKLQAEKLRASEEELKQQSEELRVSNEELEEKQLSLSKKNEIVLNAKQELQIQRDELALASKYKSEFLANMSHELRTPLNSMLILSKSLADNREGNLSPEQRQDAQIVYEGGKGLLGLINDIMDLSKVEAGMLDLHIESVELQRVAKNMEVVFARVASEKNVEFSISVQSEAPQAIHSDGKRLEQVLKNFLSNAFKFTSKGRVLFSIGPVDKNVQFRNSALSFDKAVAFVVKDSGIGIPVAKQNAIFEAFQQVDGSTSRKYGGTGLGLSISREISSLLGGEIHLESVQGEGSTFTLYIPITISESDINESFGLAETGSSNIDGNRVSPARYQPDVYMGSCESIEPGEIWLSDDRAQCSPGDNSILIVEDDKTFASVLLRLARARNFKAIVTNKGRDGLLLAENYQPSGVLLDLGLPDIHGYQVLEQLKYHIKTRHIPVHIISGVEANDTDRIGVVSFLKKPIEEETLVEVFNNIRKVLAENIKTLLVIEDDLANQQAISRLLDNDGIKISFASQLNDAEEMLAQKRFSCIILDLGLPEVEGIEAVNRITGLANAKDTPIVIYTGREMSDAEFAEISERTTSVIVKGKASLDRLVDDVSLFLHKMDFQQQNISDSDVSMHHDEDAMLKERRVLLVDDDMRNVFALKRQLEAVGIDVSVAENGQVAIDQVNQAEQVFELILMDIMMPIMDGYEAMRKLREIPAYQKVPIIALTANAMPEDRKKCIDAGASEYLTKPVDMDRLFSMLRVWLFKSKVNIS